MEWNQHAMQRPAPVLRGSKHRFYCAPPFLHNKSNSKVLFPSCLVENVQVEIANHRILYHFVFRKSKFDHVIGVTLNPFDGLDDVPEVIRKALRIAAHTNPASPKTASRKLSARALGVNTSTGTPSS